MLYDEGRVTRLVEKPACMDHRLAVVGVYYVHDSARLIGAIEELMERDIQTKGEYYLADAFTLMMEQGAHFGVREVSVWEDTGTPQAVLQTNRYLLEHGSDNGDQAAAHDSVIIPPVYIAASARVEHSIVGPHVTVAEHAVVRNSIVRDSIIGEAAFLDCTMLEGSLIGHEAVVRERARVLNVCDSSQVDLAPFED